MTEATFAGRVSRWYEQNARDLPWRHPGVGAWAILVSEVMLQQTPVARVLPAWHAWLERWPTPAALAQDSPAEAIRMWGRLGYPRRALRLRECAVAIVARHGGTVPDRLDQLLALPGVGTYTARAVAAFAYGQRHPVVDTNVRRVVCRAVAGEPDAGPATRPADLVATEELLPAEPAAAALASAAIMELGAVICTARAPRCDACPVETICAWRASGQVAPVGPTRRPQRYAGTDRQVRGLLLGLLRESTGPVPQQRLDQVWADEVQRARALAGLVTDGLVEPVGEASFRLLGDGPPTGPDPVPLGQAE
ncbi:A/G-specific adenine glycosylase [Micromonospora endophytica]|uniref:Adenine DNA glycosylase n=1 Tax=Micromonospora endophytica TaxID=515350 RepID=A0A2W2CZL1_9ACTN|nr:A/G-specific adenine glycosylase [Micromonospora endophytica]PZF98854.1 adenine glycosylase [Micromonospora endophytica]RIW46604.1 A/G-specific adenine glycosylase [Micromonospora endophytica]BCJ59867.1 adenine glycosylase [Micromonospora endophytica]